MKNKYAIVGAGASAMGTYLAFKKIGIKNFDIYDSSYTNKSSESDEKFNSLFDQGKISEIYKILKKKIGFKIINKKTEKFSSISEISKECHLWDNNFEFGLTNYWGGAVQLFDKEICMKNNFDYTELKNTYLDLLKYIPITSYDENFYDDNLNFSNQDKIQIHEINEILKNSLRKSEDFKFTTNSAAIYNNKNNQRYCRNCTHCLIGCRFDSFLNSRSFFHNEKNINIIKETVFKINSKNKEIVTENNSRSYEKIFLCAGPYQSQKIISFGNLNIKNYRIKDSFCFTFPIFYFGKIQKKHNYNEYFGLTNLILNIKENEGDLAQVQIYPPLKHIFFSLINKPFLRIFKFIYNLFIGRILFCRVYLTDKFCIVYEFDNEENLNFKKIKPNNAIIKKVKKSIFKKIKQNLINKKFYVVPLSFESKTSSHYSGDLNKDLIKNFEDRQIYINDSSTWNFLPSVSPTFSIIALAFLKTIKLFKNER